MATSIDNDNYLIDYHKKILEGDFSQIYSGEVIENVFHGKYNKENRITYFNKFTFPKKNKRCKQKTTLYAFGYNDIIPKWTKLHKLKNSEDRDDNNIPTAGEGIKLFMSAAKHIFHVHLNNDKIIYAHIPYGHIMKKLEYDDDFKLIPSTYDMDEKFVNINEFYDSDSVPEYIKDSVDLLLKKCPDIKSMVFLEIDKINIHKYNMDLIIKTFNKKYNMLINKEKFINKELSFNNDEGSFNIVIGEFENKGNNENGKPIWGEIKPIEKIGGIDILGFNEKKLYSKFNYYEINNGNNENKDCIFSLNNKYWYKVCKKDTVKSRINKHAVKNIRKPLLAIHRYYLNDNTLKKLKINKQCGKVYTMFNGIILNVNPISYDNIFNDKKGEKQKNLGDNCIIIIEIKDKNRLIIDGVKAFTNVINDFRKGPIQYMLNNITTCFGLSSNTKNKSKYKFDYHNPPDVEYLDMEQFSIFKDNEKANQNFNKKIKNDNRKSFNKTVQGKANNKYNNACANTPDTTLEQLGIFNKVDKPMCPFWEIALLKKEKYGTMTNMQFVFEYDHKDNNRNNNNDDNCQPLCAVCHKWKTYVTRNK